MNIIQAIRLNNIKLVKEFIKIDGDYINFQDEDGNTALIWASLRGYLEIIKELIKAKANLNLQNKYGSTALIKAIHCNNLKIVKELIKTGGSHIDLNLQDKDGNTALIHATMFHSYLDIITELIKANGDVDLNLRNKYGMTALMYACKNGYIKIVKELIKANAIIDNEFIKVIKKYDIDLLKLLVKRNFNIGLEYGSLQKQFNKQKDSDVDSSKSTSMASHARSIKFYVKLLIINYINNLNIYQYEKGLINMISNYLI